MTKEYVIDHYGTVRWTIGSGCSGGSLAQQQVANAYPGVYQGITPQCSFTDAWSSAMQYEEYFFGLQYLENPTRWGPGVVYDPVAIERVLRPPEPRQPDHVHDGDPELGRAVAVVPRACPTSRSTTRTRTRTGVRCTLQDYMVNAFGRDANGLGAARLRQRRRPVRAEGPARRADLAGAVRRLQHAHRRRRPRPQHHRRSAPRPTRSRCGGSTGPARSTRPTTSTRSRSSTCAGPTPAPSTTSTAPTRCARGSMRNFGTAANQVLWRGAGAAGRRPVVRRGRGLRDRPLARARRTPTTARSRSRARSSRTSPRTSAPAAPTAQGNEQSVGGLRPDGRRRTGRRGQGADGPLTEDVMKCQLKPMRRDDYPVTFTDEQWAAPPAGVPRRRLRLHASPASTSAARSRGSPTRTARAA